MRENTDYRPNFFGDREISLQFLFFGAATLTDIMLFARPRWVYLCIRFITTLSFGLNHMSSTLIDLCRKRNITPSRLCHFYWESVYGMCCVRVRVLLLLSTRE